MAVTKIRRVSSWTLLAIAVISLVVLGIFYFGGVENPGEDLKKPIYTSLLLDWTSIIFFASIALMLIFGIVKFIEQLRYNTRSAVMALICVVVFAALLGITYAIGDDTPLKVLNSDSQKFNTPGWLKVTDMWILSTGILLVAIIACIIWGAIKKAVSR